VSVAKRRRSWHSEWLSVVGRAIFTSPNPKLGPKSRWCILEMVASGRVSPLSSLVTFDHRNKTFLLGLDSKEDKIGSKYIVKSSHSLMHFLFLMAIRGSLRIL
jgi:hypothetical protein